MPRRPSALEDVHHQRIRDDPRVGRWKVAVAGQKNGPAPFEGGRYDDALPGEFFSVDFQVTPESSPSSNIHVLIGRNGVGKTTLLRNLAGAVVRPDTDGHFGSKNTNAL
ncbi:hypothetical protein ACIQ6K_24975 [Streptomyces sp. NPDC096354]|uniref:hypothetical protein n=1 Tax=Streptomyces sp. NPDC096354 TaxID=3366088 RepID=UPI003822EC45